MVQHSFYHSLLRILSLTVALVLVFESGMVAPFTHDLTVDTRQFLASAVGMNASVTPNELNQLTAELTARKRALEDREAALSEREIAVGLNTSGDFTGSLSTFMLSTVLFILLLLILMNYLLDYLRQNRRINVPTAS